MKFEAVVKAFLPHFAAFFGLLLTELSPGLQLTFGALDDEDFFVVEGSGWR